MNQPAVWYLMRASGIVALLLLTAVSALGVATVTRWRPGRTSRFLALGLHRSISLLAVAFLAIHVLTAIVDPDAAVRLVAVVLPLPLGHAGIWVALGALAFDLVAAITITSVLRERLSPRAWRGVHLAAYAAWPVALLHGIGMGTDAGAGWMLAVDAACIGLFAAAVALRLWKAPSGESKHLAPRMRVAP
ncbi:MAG TPA: ferric reductase-like transmembrane domain-containing protein [Gaiellales bacterium]|jgi:sulfoxide reductase heme-binding subunit YedZ